MDEIDGMHKGDKGGITALVKLIRQKKTKKQKTEHVTLNPIICIGNYYMDKKIKELMKVCNVFELPTPTDAQISRLLTLTMKGKQQGVALYLQDRCEAGRISPDPTVLRTTERPTGGLVATTRLMRSVETPFYLRHQVAPENAHIPPSSSPEYFANPDLLKQMVQYAQGDIRKVEFLLRLHEKKPDALNGDNIQNILRSKYYNEDYGKIAKQLFDAPLAVEQHADFMNDNDRTTVALLWHETVVDRLEDLPRELALPFYLRLIDNICFADYIDRITFQNQIWIFNEMSTFIKTFHNNYLFHRFFEKRPANELEKIRALKEVRFTKILTKYSTEYSNQLFLYMLCQELDMDKKDVVAFFQELRMHYGSDFMNRMETLNDAEKIFEDTKIGKLDIKRVYRYLDKNVKKELSKGKAKSSAEEDDIDGFLDDDFDDEDEM
jgi:hypothetical protein